MENGDEKKEDREFIMCVKVEYWWKYIHEHPDFTGCLIDKNGTKAWYLNGKCHREDGLPAVEWADGSKAWYLNGKYHREDGLPAIERANGHKTWCLKGELHRENGPAIEWASGNKEWWLNGKRYTEQEWKMETRRRKIEKLLCV